jgi:2,3-bisphosphoglycerate-independent phosphoglycerate mutase
VPVVLLGGGDASLSQGRLADIAPTLLELMGIPQPVEMNGTSLLRRSNRS